MLLPNSPRHARQTRRFFGGVGTRHEKQQAQSEYGTRAKTGHAYPKDQAV